MSERESARAWARRHGISLPPEEEQQRAVDRETGKRIAEEPCPGCEEKAREVEELERSVMEEIRNRDDANDAVARIHVALGGDGEWKAKPGSVCAAGETGDLAIDCPAMAESLRAEVDEVRTAHARRLRRVGDAVETLRGAFKLRPGCDTIGDAAEDAVKEAESLRARVRKLGEVVRELLDIDESTSMKSDELLVRIASSRSGDATWCAAILNVRAALRGEDAQ